MKKVKDEETRDKLEQNLTYEIDQLKERIRFQGLYKYVSYFYETSSTLIDYLPEDATIFVDEISRVQETAERLDGEESGWKLTMLEQGEAPHNLHLSTDFQGLLQAMHQQVVYFSIFMRNIQVCNLKTS